MLNGICRDAGRRIRQKLPELGKSMSHFEQVACVCVCVCARARVFCVCIRVGGEDGALGVEGFGFKISVCHSSWAGGGADA